MTKKINSKRGFIIAAPSSGSGKTVVSLGLISHLVSIGIEVASAKVGPDYIDPAFHAAAGGRQCFNLDPWAMRSSTLALTASALNAEIVVCEGVMGLFDGAQVKAGPDGSTADLSYLTGWPVILVIDAHSQSGSAAALLKGFSDFRSDIIVAGVIFNCVGSAKHEKILREACRQSVPNIPVIGCIPRSQGLDLPERHLGLVQALEHPNLEAFIKNASDLIKKHVNVDCLLELAKPLKLKNDIKTYNLFPPLGGRIAIACDEAFSFSYASMIKGWRKAGAEIYPFSPLADESPDKTADALYLPGGYPELNAGRLASASKFLGGMQTLAKKGATIFGECGGYMVLGKGLTDAKGVRHTMSGLLGLETSFAKRQLHLGYRRIRTLTNSPLGQIGTSFRGHEFHYSTVISEVDTEPLFEATDAEDNNLGTAGLVNGKVMGSFFHLIDLE
jgi:cobyrinic acid a,c-diamide synthase